MGRRTGNPRGRPKGSKNVANPEKQAAIEKAAKKIERLIPNAFDGNAHALLMAIYKDETQPMDMRLDAAKSAIRYESPALSAIETKQNQEQFDQQQRRIEDMDVTEIARHIAFVLAEAGRKQAQQTIQ